MKKLMILSTGGTIACTQTADGLIPTLSADDILAYAPEAKRLGIIETRTILNLDSSNIQPEEWRLIAGAIFECLPDYDGIVVLHGTDTMAYTASALSFLLPNLSKPVILTGSQLSLENVRSDGREHIITAILLAGTAPVPLHVVSAFMDTKERLSKERAIAEIGAQGAWVWRTEEPMPPIV